MLSPVTSISWYSKMCCTPPPLPCSSRMTPESLAVVKDTPAIDDIVAGACAFASRRCDVNPKRDSMQIH